MAHHFGGKPGRYHYGFGEMERLGSVTSAHEKRAEDATRDVEAWLKCQYMEQHLGDEFDGVVTGVTNFGLFVQISDLLVIQVNRVDMETRRIDFRPVERNG